MDSPFFPALICFGPFFLFLFIHILTQGRPPAKRTPAAHILIAVLISLGIGIAGTALSYLII